MANNDNKRKGTNFPHEAIRVGAPSRTADRTESQSQPVGVAPLAIFLEANVVGILTEAAAADVKTVFPNDATAIVADTAASSTEVSTPIGRHTKHRPRGAQHT